MDNNRKYYDVTGLDEFFYVDGAQRAEELVESSDEEVVEREEEEVVERDEVVEGSDEDDDLLAEDLVGQLRDFVLQQDRDAGDEQQPSDDGSGEEEDGGAVRAVGAAVEQEQTLKELSGCRCPNDKCISLLSKETVEEIRLFNGSFENKTVLDMLILGKIATCINRGATTSTAKHKAKERTYSRTVYRHEGEVMCRSAFCYINTISTKKLTTLTKHYCANGAVPRDFKYKGRNKRAVTYEQAKRIVRFIQGVARVHALALPGRVPGIKRTDVKVMPSDLNIIGLWKEYCNVCEQDGEIARSRMSFTRVWKAILPYIIISKPKSDLCWTCQQYNNNYVSTQNKSEEEKLKYIASHNEHLQEAASARRHMNACIDRCKELLPPDAKLGRTNPQTGPAEAHYCFDFAQQLHYPCDPHQPGPIYFKTTRKCGVFGVCCPALPCQVNYLIDEAVATSNGANAVISYLHHFLDEYGLGEKRIVLHADNCSGQNKNSAMMAYLMWRVDTGRNTSAEMNFLIAGHTKFSCDLCFGWLKKKTRVTKLSCLDDIVQAVEKSSRANKSQLVGTQDGRVVVKVYDWSSFLAVTKIKGLKKYHQFSISSEKTGIITLKKYATSDTSVDHRMWVKAPEGWPVQIEPAGLERARQLYLYKEIREFCTPATRDIVCPQPPAIVEEDGDDAAEDEAAEDEAAEDEAGEDEAGEDEAAEEPVMKRRK